MIKKILVALDYSKATVRVFEEARELATSLNARVTLLHVLSETTQYSYLNYSPILGFDSFSDNDIVQTSTVEEVRKAATEFLGRFKAEMDGIETETLVREGDFADEILNTAVKEGVDLIIIGSHGRKGLDKILMGSVAEKVIHKSEVPVMVVPIRNKRG